MVPDASYAEIMPEPIAPPIVEPAAPAAEIMPEPIVPPIVEPVAPVAETMPEPIAPPIVEPVAPAAASAPANDFVPGELGFITESNPLVSETAKTSAQTASPTATAVLPEPITESVSKAVPPLNRPDNPAAENAPDASKGKLVYCRNCGQDMYDTEKVCKNCGAPYKGAYVPPRNAPSSGKSDEPKKIFGIFTPSVFAGIIVVAIAVIALGIFIGVRSNGIKPVTGGETASVSTSTDSGSQSADTASGNSSDVPPIQSTDNTSTSSDDPTSSDDTSTSEDPNSGSSSSSDVESSSSSSSSKTQSSSSTKTQSSSSSKTQSSTKTNSSSSTQSSTGPTNQMSAKVQSLETDRVKIMNAIARLSGEMGKIDIFVRHISYELDNTKITKETTLKNFFNSDLGKEFANSIQGNRVSTNSVVDSAAPVNSEMNGLYQSLKNLQRQYIDACNAVLEPTNANNFVSNATGYINSFNSMLTQQLGFNKFMLSAYTSANKDQAYLSVLKLAKSMINESSNGLSTVQSAVLRLGESRFDSISGEIIGNNAAAYVDAAAAAGRVNAYRIMLLGVQSSYSSSYSSLSSSYSALSNAFRLNSEIQAQTYSQYTTLINQYIASARVGASKISS
ncbi:MAG: hypothetical protein K2N56_06400 [Oscillospiraceae bacterium]|nr:hypothetical protein [Oscillospiraceae bacterium]